MSWQITNRLARFDQVLKLQFKILFMIFFFVDRECQNHL